MAFPGVGGPPLPPGAVIQQQWMPRPEVPGCPPGLEYLTQIDQLLVHQSVELLEAFTDIECQNRFAVKNAAGQQIYFAAEESGFCTRQCCGPHRGFVMHMADNFGQEVLRATREFKCCAGCCWCACLDCCAYEIMVEAPVGNVVGYVRQSCSIIQPVFEILNEDHETVLTLEGPICICECPCCDVEFNESNGNHGKCLFWFVAFYVIMLTTNSGHEVGKIHKQWTGLVKELFTHADNFGITFPMDLDVKVKATLVGAVFLINMMFFEKRRNDNNN